MSSIEQLRDALDACWGLISTIDDLTPEQVQVCVDNHNLLWHEEEEPNVTDKVKVPKTGGERKETPPVDQWREVVLGILRGGQPVSGLRLISRTGIPGPELYRLLDTMEAEGSIVGEWVGDKRRLYRATL